MSRLAVLIVLSSLVAAMRAQVVTPSYAAAFEGNVRFRFFSNMTPRHWQQAHGDLRGRPMTLNSLSLRRDRASDQLIQLPTGMPMDLWLGRGDRTQMTGDPSANFVGTPTHVAVASRLDIPGGPGRFGDMPRPFDIRVPLEIPYIHDGTLDLVWLMRFPWGQSSFIADLDGADANAGLGYGYRRRVGFHCPSSNLLLHAEPMSMREHFLFGWTIYANGPDVTGVILIGAPIALAVPGLCSGTLWTDGSLGIATFRTNLTGWLDLLTTHRVPYSAHHVGILLAAQIAVLDPSQPGIPVAVSAGNYFSFGPMPISMPVTTVTNMLSTGSQVLPDTGLVVEFR
jgi:hypothetical protein